MKAVEIKTAECHKKEQQGELIKVLAEMSVVTQRLAERLALLE